LALSAVRDEIGVLGNGTRTGECFLAELGRGVGAWLGLDWIELVVYGHVFAVKWRGEWYRRREGEDARGGIGVCG
jgi:hypothetical protein